MSKKQKVRTVEIKRSRWASADRVKAYNKNQDDCDKRMTACLYDPKTKAMCCLGFVCRAEGLPIAKIKDVGFPTEVDWGDDTEAPDWLRAVETKAAEINDSHSLTDKEREAKLKVLFAERTPVRLKFVP